MVLRDIPKLIDEPTSGLDPVSREELLHIFRQIVKSEKCSILFSTHITSDLDRCTDDITYIQNGRVLQSADKDTFLRSFEHLKTPDDTGLLVITDTILNRVTLNWKRGKRTHVFIDEFHLVFENEQSGIFFSSAWRQFRKRGAYPTEIGRAHV